MRRIFQETVSASTEKIAVCEAYLDGGMRKQDIPEAILCAALELLMDKEVERVEKMKAGIEEVSRGIPAGE